MSKIMSFFVLFVSLLGWNAVHADGSAVSACSSPGPHANVFSVFLSYSDVTEAIVCEADALEQVVGEIDEDNECRFGTAFVDPITGIGDVINSCILVGSQAKGVRLHRLRVQDRHPTENISCSLYARFRNGNTVFSSSVSTSGTGDQDIANGLTFNPGASSRARITLLCFVPGLAPNGDPSGIVDLHVDPIF